jgi:DNA-binding NtrC family response regulator
MNDRILVVDDNPNTTELIQRNLAQVGYVVAVAGSAQEAIERLEAAPVDLVITDLKMPKVSGLELVRHVRENHPDTEVMMITGYATVEGAVEAVKLGAEEYLPKPFTAEELLSVVRRVLDKLTLRRSANRPSGIASGVPYGLLGDSPAMQQIYRLIEKVARTLATVLITGESGTGKELVARAIHYGSARAAAPFVPVNCGGIPETLLESELFGHVKGAFTGATESRAGFFQTADGGTIFLDEIGETSPPMQVKLLRVLQDHEVCMVGAQQARRVDVRIMAATNKSLPNLVRRGTFREDLFFRLNVVALELPPLRDRENDVLLLARHFVRRFAEENGREPPILADEVLQAFRGYPWPGNVRELENIVHRLVVMSDEPVLDVTALPAYMRYSVPRSDELLRPLAEVETEHVRRVVAAVGGNKSRAAEILGIDRKTLRVKLQASEPDEDAS